ncbi:MAG: hypothetical protein D4S01_06155 [Dehalococcoidia bacterium]|nr:MAG: hypothetical protein D4S01_06155 [Dehalococcoidia bacterium]
MFSGYAAQAEKIIFEYRQQVSIPEDAKILNPLCDYYNPAIREAAQKITAGCKDDYEKARRLSTWVMKNIRRESPFEWFSTDKASVTLKESIGSHFSRVNLLIAMLRAVGVDAQYAVIKESKGRYEGIIVGKDYKSMAEELEHLFVAVGIDGERIFIDIDRSSDRDGDLLMDRFLLSEYSIEEEPTYYDDISQLAHERAAVYDRAKIREFGREILAYQNAQLLSRIKDRCAQISLSINGIEDNRQDGWRAIGSAIEDIEEFFAYAGRYDYTLAERFISDSLSVLRDIIMDRSRGLDPRLFSSTENDYRRLGSRIRNLVSVALTDGYIPEVVEEFEWAEERPLLGIFDEAWQSNFYPSRWDGQERADKMNLLLYSAADQIDAPDIKEVYLSSGMIRGKGSRLQFVIFKEPVRVDASISPKREEGRKIITEKLPLLYRQANKSFRERGPDDGLALRLVLSSMPESTDSVLGKPLTNMAVVHSYLKMRLKDMNLDISFFTDGPVVSDEEIERIDPGLLPYPEGVNIGIMPMSTAGLSLAGVLAQRGDIEGVNFIYFLPVNNLVGSDSDKGRAYVQYGIFLDKNGKIRFGQFEQPIELHAVCHAGISMSKSASQFFQTRKIPILNSLQMLSFIADKIAFGKFLEDSGLPYPKTLAIPSDRSSDAAREAIGKFVTGDSLAGVAVKRQFGGCGTSVKMFETDKMSRAVNFALLLKERDNNVIVQERIDPVEIFDSDGVRLDWNLRIIATWKDGKPVIDKVMIETRSREYGSEPVNKSQGAETMSLKKFFEKYDFSDKQREQLVSGAEGLITEAMIKLRDYAIDRGISPNELYAKPGLVGWDIIQREDGQLYIIEANAGSVGGIQTLESLAEEPERGKALMPLLHYLKEMAMDYKDSIGEDSRNDSENVRFPDPYAEVNNEISVTAIDSMIRLSMLYLWGAKFKEAEGVLYLLIEKGVRGNASVWTGLATVKYLQNQTAQAEVFARKAISVDRYSVEAWKQLAKILISKRQLLEARLIYRPLIAMNIKSPSLRIDYLNLLFRMSCSKKNSMEEAKRAALAFHRNAKKAFLAYIRELSETSRIRYPFWNQLVRWLRQKHPEVIEGDDLNRLIDMAEAPRGVDFSKLSMEDIRAFAQKRPEAIEIGLLLLGIKPAYLATRPRYASDFNMLADVKKAIKDMPEIKMIYLNDGSPIIYNEQSVRAIIENNPDFYGQFGPVDDLGIFMKRVFSEDFGGQLLGYGTQRNLKDAKYFLKICDIDWNPVIGFAVKESEASELGTKYVEGLKVFTGRPHRFLVSRVLNRAESSTVKRTAAELISAERVSEKFYQIPGLVEAVPDSFCLKRGWDSFRYCRISPTKLLVRESLLRDKSALADILTTFSQPELSASPRLGLGEGVRVVNSIASAA